MLDTSSSQFDSFLFWRPPIPSLDLSELEDLGLSDSSSKKDLDADDLSEFSSLIYWKEPITSIDLLDLLL